jgi:ribulose-phosphate 3-epimerase
MTQWDGAHECQHLTRASIAHVAWTDWMRGEVEVCPSLYAADFMRLGEQIEALLAGGCRIFHFDVGDGHFIPPVTIGPVILRSIAPAIHAAGGILDCHLMVDDPAHHFEEIAASGGDAVTFHVEVTDDPAGVAGRARELGLAVGIAFNPQTTPAEAAAFARTADAEIALCMSIQPGYSGQRLMPDAFARIAEIATLLPVPIQVDGGVGAANAAEVHAAGARLLVAGSAIFADPDPADAYRRIVAGAAAE